MQMRFDGLLGFPGGLVDPGENPLQAANRELEEEIGLDMQKFKLSDRDHVISFVNKSKTLVLHFYGREVTLPQFQEIELENLKAPDYGSEVYILQQVLVSIHHCKTSNISYCLI